MSPRSLKFGVLLILMLFCVSELGRFRPLLVKSQGDVATTKQLKEGGGEEKNPHGFALCCPTTLELAAEFRYSESGDRSSAAPQLSFVGHHLRGPPVLAPI